MEAMGLKFTPVVVRGLLGPLCMLGPIAGILGFIASPNSSNGGFNLHPAAHYPPHPLSPTHPFIHATCDITVVVKNIAQNPAVLAR